MAKLTFRQEAINDLSEIWEYTAEYWSESQANKYYQSIASTCQVVAKNPGTGKRYSAIHPNLYGYRINKHIIFYHIISVKEIEVIRILHSQMDLKNNLSD